MEIVRNNIIPFKGYKCVNLFGILFVRDDAVIGSVDINHESIHTAQMKEMLYVFFYLWYLIEWLVKLPKYGKKSYNNISFEREAYQYDRYADYVQFRKKYNWIKYL